MLASQCFLVVGTYRSGTSCVAGVLHHLGVFMGSNLMVGPLHNAKGYFHDLDFQLARDDESRLKELIRQRQESHSRWGVNVRFADEILHLFPSPKVLLTNRRLSASTASLARMNRGTGFDLAGMAAKNREAVNALGIIHMVVDFDELIDAREQTIAKIAGFVGLPVAQEAIDFVDPDLRHHQ